MAKIIKNSAKNASINSTNGKSKKKAGRKPVDPNETPVLRFDRLAGTRLGRVIQGMKGLRQLTACVKESVKDNTVKDGQKTGVYFEEENWNWIFAEIDKAYNRLKKAHANGGPGTTAAPKISIGRLSK